MCCWRLEEATQGFLTLMAGHYSLLMLTNATSSGSRHSTAPGGGGGISRFPMSGCGGSGPLSKASAGSRGESFSAAINIFVDVRGMISEHRYTYCRSDSTVQDVS